MPRYAIKTVLSSGVSRQHSQSRENINLPEDEVVGGSEGGIEEISGLASPGKMNPHQTHSEAKLKLDCTCQGYHMHL